MKRYLIALPSFRCSKGFCHRTILISAKDENEAISIAMNLKPHDNIGYVKEVSY